MSDLWLADRSRYEAQHNHCARHRYYEYHSGPTGYGIRLKAQSLYATTGIYLHNIAEEVTHLQAAHGWENDLIPTHRDEVRQAILRVVGRYHRLLETRGLKSSETTDIQHWIISEQATLIEGLGWAFVYDLLPWLRVNFSEPVTIEQEELTVIGCTCGIGDLLGTEDEHESRNCAGVGWMSRADLILPRRSDGELGWHDYKTSGNPFAESFDRSWHENVQFAAGILGAERSLGKPISHYYIHGFSKGIRRKDDISKFLRHLAEGTRTKLQGSPLCYAYLKEADPPATPVEDWQPKHEWWERDEHTGSMRKRRLGKGYKKREIWREGNFPGKLAGQSNVEYWMEWIRASNAGEGREEREEGAGLIHTVGPYPRPSRLIEAFQAEMPAAEKDWQAKLWRLYDAKAQAVARLESEGAVVDHAELNFAPEVQQAVNENFPRNWSGCESYYGDRCDYHPVCHFDAGWDMPETIGFVPRRPHHDPEREQMAKRGLPVPEEEDIEDGYGGES